ncbi:MAG: Hsp70 family protein [Planctomycetota bacterium]
MSKAIGINLGERYAVAAHASADGATKVLEGQYGRLEVPCAVGLKRSRGAGDAPETLVGDVAEQNWQLAPKDTIVSVRRLMGHGIADPEVQRVRQWAMYDIVAPTDSTEDSVRVVMGGKQYSPVGIWAQILRKVKEDAEYRFRDEVTHAVIAVPAYFNGAQRDATRRAGLRAGLKMKVLDEPTTAAIAFGIEEKESNEPKYLLVYDLNGGTFDVSVLMSSGHVLFPLNLQGDMWLGGDNFDQAIVEYAMDGIRREYEINPVGNSRLMVALRHAAQAAKERLSSARSADSIVSGCLRDASGDIADIEVEVTCQQYWDLIRGTLEQMMTLTRKAMDTAGLSAENIDTVLLVGKRTYEPAVRSALAEVSDARKVDTTVGATYAVAFGAAIVARCCWDGDGAGAEPGLADLINVSPAYYGTQTGGGKLNVFINKDVPYPTEEPRTQTFYTAAPDQGMVRMPIYARDELEEASANEKQGEAFAILPPGLRARPPVCFQLALDRDCVFQLEAHLEGGTDLRPWVLKGEIDQKAVEVLTQAEREFTARPDPSPAEVQQFRQVRESSFVALLERDHETALRLARRLLVLARAGGAAAGGAPGAGEANREGVSG